MERVFELGEVLIPSPPEKTTRRYDGAVIQRQEAFVVSKMLELLGSNSPLKLKKPGSIPLKRRELLKIGKIGQGFPESSLHQETLAADPTIDTTGHDFGIEVLSPLGANRGAIAAGTRYYIRVDDQIAEGPTILEEGGPSLDKPSGHLIERIQTIARTLADPTLIV